MTKGICLVHNLGLGIKKKRERKHPTHSVQYLRSKPTTRVPDLGPTAKLVGIMAQDIVQKKKKKRERERERKKNSKKRKKKKKNRSTCY